MGSVILMTATAVAVYQTLQHGRVHTPMGDSGDKAGMGA